MAGKDVAKMSAEDQEAEQALMQGPLHTAQPFSTMVLSVCDSIE